MARWLGRITDRCPALPSARDGTPLGLAGSAGKYANVGNERLQAEGAADKTAGAVQKNLGDVKEAAKTLVKKP